MTDLSSDLAALLAAVDAQQDDCLPILADVLEDVQDERAAGIRYLIRRKRTPHQNVYSQAGYWEDKWEWWYWSDNYVGTGRHYILAKKLTRRMPWTLPNNPQWAYPTRSGAFLAAAEGFVKAKLT